MPEFVIVLVEPLILELDLHRTRRSATRSTLLYLLAGLGLALLLGLMPDTHDWGTSYLKVRHLAVNKLSQVRAARSNRGLRSRGALQFKCFGQSIRRAVQGNIHGSLLEEVAAFVEVGPLYDSLQDPPIPAEWLRHGQALILQLTGDPDLTHLAPQCLDRAVASRVYHLYLPVYFWMRALAFEKRNASAAPLPRAILIGISAPQGCGKTTLVEFLIGLFKADGLKCAAVSIDDFYLKGVEQDGLAKANSENALLQVRGNAGTHDLELGKTTLQALRSARCSDVAVPRYDKSARSGRGDRAPESEWCSLQTPCDVVLLEGWMAGFKPRSDEKELAAIHPGLLGVNQQLKAYQAWDDLVDCWCVVALEDKSHIFKWRLQAERAMAAAGRPGMDDSAVNDFVKRYMPAYEAYCPALYASSVSNGLDGKPTFLVYVDGTRNPVAQPS